VDLTHLVGSIRPAVRTQLSQSVDYSTVRRWARRRGWFVAIDDDGFLVFSPSPGLARHLLAIDRSPGRHTYKLGRSLGYPPCCCRAAARVGDEALDSWSTAMSARLFVGRFKAIDPRGYREGRAFISHIPCTPACVPSLRMAEDTKKVATSLLASKKTQLKR
jgi:hypothetical protein